METLHDISLDILNQSPQQSQYRLDGRDVRSLENSTSEQFHLSPNRIHALIDGPTTPETKLSSHPFLQMWSSANKEEEPGALLLLPHDVRSIKRGTEMNRNKSSVAEEIKERPLSTTRKSKRAAHTRRESIYKLLYQAAQGFGCAMLIPQRLN